MTDNEKLSCLIDRPCTACKFHNEDGCVKWSCVFEEKSDVPEGKYIKKEDLFAKTIDKNKAWLCTTNAEGKNLKKIVEDLPTYSFPEGGTTDRIEYGTDGQPYKYSISTDIPEREKGTKYYKADDVIKVLLNNGYGDEENGADPEYMTALSDVRRGLDNISVFAVPEREKGEWVTDDTTGSSSNTDYHCSNCGRKLQMTYILIKAYQENGQYLFCDHCGADMRGGKE